MVIVVMRVKMVTETGAVVPSNRITQVILRGCHREEYRHQGAKMVMTTKLCVDHFMLLSGVKV